LTPQQDRKTVLRQQYSSEERTAEEVKAAPVLLLPRRGLVVQAVPALELVVLEAVIRD